MDINRIDISKYANLVFVGDLHGNWESFCFEVNEQKCMKDTVIIVCGDIGVGFERDARMCDVLDRICPKFEKKGNAVFALRGNHDDPSYFNSQDVTEEKVKGMYVRTGRKYSEGKDGMVRDAFRLIPDYTVLSNGAHNILCIGGARSIDRCLRVEGISCWEGENVSDIPEGFYESLLENGINVDTVCTHTSPSIAYPDDNVGTGMENTVKAFAERDDTLLSDIANERNLLSGVYGKLVDDGHKVRNWVYGHFHEHYSKRMNNGGVETTFTGLDMFYPYKVSGKNGNKHYSDVFQIDF